MLRKFSEIWARALKNIRHACLRPRKYTENRFEGRQIINLPGAPTCLGPGLGCTKSINTETGKKMKYKPKNPQKFINIFYFAYSNQLHVSVFNYKRINLKYSNLKW
jgi:hypothetical protein